MNTLLEIGRVTDVSAVRADVTMAEVDQMVAVVRAYNCVCASPMPFCTRYVVERLEDRPSTVVTGVVSFPAGAETTATKVHTAREMLAAGCEELDMVMNISAFKTGHYSYVQQDIRAVVEAAGPIPVKVILEICYLNDDEIARASELVAEAGAAYVKTGTGWGPKPTTVETIRTIRASIGNAARIKAAGGVRDLDTLLAMQAAGCDRFGIGVRSALAIFGEAYRRAGAEPPTLELGALADTGSY